MAILGILAAGATIVNAISNISSSNRNARIAKDAADDALLERQRQQAALDVEKARYRAMTFENPFRDMENTFEDLTVNQQQAQFQAQQGAQQRANIMQNLRGAAGASGIAALAQTLANQGQIQAQRISASIGQQEAANQMAAAKAAGTIQIAERKGDAMVQQLEANREATILGMQMGAASGANLASARAQANQMQAQMAQSQSFADAFTNIGTTLAGTDFSGLQKTTTTGSTGSTGSQFNMAIPSGTSASGAPLTVPVMTPTGGEVSTGGPQYNYGKKVIGFNPDGSPIYG